MEWRAHGAKTGRDYRPQHGREGTHGDLEQVQLHLLLDRRYFDTSMSSASWLSMLVGLGYTWIYWQDDL